MARSKFYAFFTNPQNNRSLEELNVFTWVKSVRTALNQPFADVVIIKPNLWNPPKLGTVDPEIAVGEIVRIAAAMSPYLEEHGVSREAIIQSAVNIAIVPYTEFEMLVFVFEYTAEWQDRAFLYRKY